MLVSCTEDYTSYVTFLRNETEHEILILPYKQGYVNEEDTILLLPKQTFQIANGHQRGVTSNAGFTSKYISASDSLKVIFDGNYFVSHYINTPLETEKRHYLYNSLRNLIQYKSYEYSFRDDGKHYREQTFSYTFVEADYEFAKQ